MRLSDPTFLLLLPLLPLLLIPHFRGAVKRPAWRKSTATAMRLLGMAAAIIALCEPTIGRGVDELHTVVLIDVSHSVEPESLKTLNDRLKTVFTDNQTGDSQSFIAFAKQISPLPDATGLAALQQNPDDNTATNTAKAVNAARINFPADKAKRILLVSDGLDTGGGMAEAIAALETEGGDMRLMKLDPIRRPEASVVSFTAEPEKVYVGENIRLKAVVAANRDMRATLRILNDGVSVREIPLRLRAGKRESIEAEIIAAPGDNGVLQAEIIPETDHFPNNNIAAAKIDIDGRAKVLLLHRRPAAARHFIRAMTEQQIEIETRQPTSAPRSLTEMDAYDAIIIADAAADELGGETMRAMKSFVTDLGRGLIMTGSENSFGLGGYYKTDLEDVLPVVSRYEKEKEQPGLAMTLVLDKSGSMTGAPILLARRAARAAVEMLGPNDQVGVVAFDGSAKVVCPMTAAIHTGEINGKINTIAAGGGTSMAPGMNIGMNMLENAQAKIKHMIILSDGRSSPGDFEGIARSLAGLGATVSTVALGGADRQLLKRLAEIGGGRYYEAANADAMPRIFAKETLEASRSAIREEPFLPIKMADAQFLHGIDFERAPFLLGYVMARVRPTARTLMLTESGDPLLAVGRYGLGRTAAFTADFTENWAGEWLDWPGYAKFWSQLVRFVSGGGGQSDIQIRHHHRGDTIEFKFIKNGIDGQADENCRWTALFRADGSPPRNITVTDAGFGQGRCLIDNPPGDYELIVKEEFDSESAVFRRQTGYPAEYALFQDRESNAIPELTGSIREGVSPVSIRQPIAIWFCLAAIVLMVSGVLVRRI